MNFDKIELGTPETAVKSCVNLLSRLFEQPEEYVACYLDLYYQVRRRWEEDADGGPPRASAPTGAAETPSGAARQLPRGGSQGERVPPSGAARQLPQGGSQEEHVPPSEREGDREAVEGAPADAAEAPAERVEKPVNGSTRAAQEKRRIRERFMAARAKGLTLPELIRASDGNVTEGDLWKVINAHNLGIQHYRDIDAALDRLSL